MLCIYNLLRQNKTHILVHISSSLGLVIKYKRVYNRKENNQTTDMD